METTVKRPKVKVDLIAEMDKITSKNPDMKPYEIRAEIGRTFDQAARAAGWNFRYDIWPVLREAVEASINTTEDREVLGYIENLDRYCDQGGAV